MSIAIKEGVAERLLPELKRGLARIALSTLGRRNVARLARFLGNEARLDSVNIISKNGEMMVQSAVLRHREPDHSLLVLDVGANVGDWTSALLEQADSSGCQALRVFALEPAARTFELLKSRLGGRGNVLLVQAAASDRAGPATLHVAPDRDAGTSSLHGASVGSPTEERVSMTTIDSFCADQGIEHVDLMKIDTEGHDLLVLRGAQGMLRRQAIEIVQFEYNQRWVFAHQFLRDAFELLLPLGYAIGKVTPLGVERYRGWHHELETFREGNYLAFLPKWENRLPAIKWWNDA